MENKILEEIQRARRLAVGLVKVVDVKNQRLGEMERKYEKTCATLGRTFVENDKLHQTIQALEEGVAHFLQMLKSFWLTNEVVGSLVI